MDNLKSYRENEIKWYVLAYLLLVVVVCYPTTTQSVDIELVRHITLSPKDRQQKKWVKNYTNKFVYSR